MLRWQYWALVAVCGGGLAGLMIGCHDDDRSRTVVVHEEQPVVVEREAPRQVIVVEREPRRTVVIQRDEPDVVVVNEPPQPLVVVAEAPPRVIVERHDRPPRGQVWISGYWGHESGHFVWMKGRFDRARPGYRYVDPRWQHGRTGWELHAGYWRR